VKAKLHKHKQLYKRRLRAKLKEDQRTVYATEDTKILPHSVKRVKLRGVFDDKDEWLVEKSLLANANDSYFAIGNTLISSSDPQLPIANPTDHPRYIRKGEILGRLVDPAEFFDKPSTTGKLAEMEAQANFLSSLIATLSETSDENPDDLERGYPTQDPISERSRVNPPVPAEAQVAAAGEIVNPDKNSADDADQEESWGPKSSQLPEATVYPSEEMEKILDVGELPEHLRDQAWEMLRKNQLAFAFDGRLGNYKTRARIRTNEGQPPIATRMYHSSPANKQVIETQLNKWFAQGVIEPSKSPWSAPVVIAYCQGKPRFCVDYRKLNAVTIPDEFPIPRQSEILQSLSGAQVLSSLDALAGFNQIDIDPEDVEKTGFRTHKGLFNFLRMPFGLRNGPSIFQRVMNEVLAPYLWLFCLVYIDDIVVYSQSFEEHIEHLDKVLGAIAKSGITLSPDKCHLFYSSILLLGHKVSRLGLSTHEEKVKAIQELERPSRLSELQVFLGMVVYFSAFIPFYASIASPLFHLLRKGARWEWRAEHEYAFQAAKRALQEAPVLGHPIQGLPYRLYTDASDEALGCALQQVQPIAIADLKDTKLYDRLRKAYETGQSPPKLVPTITSTNDDVPATSSWAAEFEQTVVYVERVIAYWSRTFKSAETRYSTTEREALAAKEGLVKFQPFIEGEKILLVTDHAALVWARTYENANRRLAAWGTVFAAYAPGLEIIHRPGRVHSNVDPLSRLPRAPPDHNSPIRIPGQTLQPNNDLAEAQERAYASQPASKAFVAYSITDCLEGYAEASFQTRAQRKAKGNSSGKTSSKAKPKSKAKRIPMETVILDEGGDENGKEGPDDSLDLFEKQKKWEASHPPPTIHVSLDPQYLKQFIDGYKKDRVFKEKWADKSSDPNSWYAGKRYYRDDQGLLFFRDADMMPRLCIPKSEVSYILSQAHDSAFETAHAGPEKLWQILSGKFFWPKMKNDIISFCRSCDVCQKTKPVNFNRFGRLIPNPIPTRPYASVSLDLITGLPMSNDFNAILVIVDRMGKHGQFIPTTTGLTADGFAYLFVKHVVCRFGLPDDIIADRDPRWTSDFWRAVSSYLKTKMSLSSSHHPQHDGQTEILNKRLEIMLRAYCAQDKESWSEWLHLLEFAYNSSPSASTGEPPYLLLYGFLPKSVLDFLAPPTSQPAKPRSLDRDANNFLDNLQMHRESARLAIARAQDKQASAYNKGRKELDYNLGDLVMINPHSLEWLESKGEHAKLVQRAIGPFSVQERINSKVYRLDMSDLYPGSNVFNLEHLRKYRLSPPEFGERVTLPETRDRKPASEEYQVEKIIGHRFNRRLGKVEFLVRWEGYGPQFDQWINARDLRNAPRILFEYRSQHGL
jgi:hypothetical protein